MEPPSDRAAAALPFRGAGPGASPAGPARPPLPLPPGPMPRWRGGRPLKRWRYVGVFAEQAMLCLGDVAVGPGRQTFWAVWDRGGRVLLEHTASLRHGAVRLDEGHAGVRARGVELDLLLDEEPGIECVCRHGRQYAWTRKQGGVRARGRLVLGGRELELDARAVIDDSAGYHARATAWRWSAGVGVDTDGRRVAWNLVEGINDPPARSERAVWVDGEASEPAPVRFACDLGAVSGPDGLDLRFEAEAVRERSDNLLLVRSRYRQPFGTFTGTLPDGIALRGGLGVMERHRARW